MNSFWKRKEIIIKIGEGGKKETFSKFFQNLTREKEEGIRSLAWKDQKFEISLALDFPRAQDPRSTRSDKWLPLAGGSRSKKKNPGFLYNPIHLWPGCSHPLLLVVVVGSRQLPLSLFLSLSRRNPRKFHDLVSFYKFCPSPSLFKPFSRRRRKERKVSGLCICVLPFPSNERGLKIDRSEEFWGSFEGSRRLSN